MAPSRTVSNIQINSDNIIVSINTKIYPKEVVYYAAYAFLDRAFIVIDGNPDNTIFVELRPKDRQKDLEELGWDFNNEMLNYIVYKQQLETNKEVKDAILQRTFETVTMAPIVSDENVCEATESLDDPLGIAKPWDEKYAPKAAEADEQPAMPRASEGQDTKIDSSLSYRDDPLGIAKPWEETHKDEK